MNKNQKKWLVISIVIVIVLALGLGLGLGLGLKKQDTHDSFSINQHPENQKAFHQYNLVKTENPYSNHSITPPGKSPVMKLALQIYGQLRTFKTCLPSLLDYISYKDHDVDVFLLIDKGQGSIYNSNYSLDNISILKNMLGESNIKILKYVDEMSQDDVNTEINLTNEYYRLVTKFIKTNNMNYIHNNFVNKLFYRKYVINRLRNEYQEANNIKYDYVVRSRFDYGRKNIGLKFNFNDDFNAVVWPDTQEIAKPEFIDKLVKIALDFPITPKIIYDDNCQIRKDKYEEYKKKDNPEMGKNKFQFWDQGWVFMPEMNQILYCKENNLEYVYAGHKGDGFDIIR